MDYTENVGVTCQNHGACVERQKKTGCVRPVVAEEKVYVKCRYDTCVSDDMCTRSTGCLGWQ